MLSAICSTDCGGGWCYTPNTCACGTSVTLVKRVGGSWPSGSLTAQISTVKETDVINVILDTFYDFMIHLGHRTY